MAAVEKLLLGVDVGTTGTKSMVIDKKGNILAAAYKGYPTYNDNISWAEQDALDWWEAVASTIRECTKDRQIKERLCSIGLSSQGGSLIPVDMNGNPVRRAITWMDHRGREQSEFYKSSLPKDYFYNTTGWKLTDSLNAVQIRWIKDNEPDVFNKTYKFLSAMDFIIFKLTGRYVIDPSNAGITQLANIIDNKWDKNILELAGITENKLSSIVYSGEKIGVLSMEAAEILGLSTEVSVASGGHDQYCAALGAGAINEGDILLATGTAWVVLAVSNRPMFDCDTYIAQSNHTVKGRWGSICSVGVGGMSLDWFRRTMGESIQDVNGSLILQSYSQIDKMINMKPAGANGVMFFPHFNGSDCPNWASFNKGTFLGLDLSHDRYDIARAVMEGVAFEANWMLDVFRSKGICIKKLKMIGGASRSSPWVQIIADITGVPVVIPDCADIACVGAAILGGIAAGLIKDGEEGYSMLTGRESEILPVEKNVNLYKLIFEKYKKRFEFLKNCYEVL